MLVAINYHYVRPDFSTPYPGLFGVTPAQFRAQLELLAQHAEFVGLEQCRAVVRRTAGFPQRAILITFDDGLREQYEHALPVLDALQVPAAFFINTRPIVEQCVLTVHKIHYLRSHLPPDAFERLVYDQLSRQTAGAPWSADRSHADGHYRYDEPSAAQLKRLLNHALAPADCETLIGALFHDRFPALEPELHRELYMEQRHVRQLGQRGMVGSHTHDHVPLHRVDSHRQQQLFAEAANWLAQWTGSTPFAASYPYGYREIASDAVVAAARQHGVELAFTMERAANFRFDAPLRLARFDCNDAPGGKCCDMAPDDWFDSLTDSAWYRAPTAGAHA